MKRVGKNIISIPRRMNFVSGNSGFSRNRDGNRLDSMDPFDEVEDIFVV